MCNYYKWLYIVLFRVNTWSKHELVPLNPFCSSTSNSSSSKNPRCLWTRLSRVIFQIEFFIIRIILQSLVSLSFQKGLWKLFGSNYIGEFIVNIVDLFLDFATRFYLELFEFIKLGGIRRRLNFFFLSSIVSSGNGTYERILRSNRTAA